MITPNIYKIIQKRKAGAGHFNYTLSQFDTNTFSYFLGRRDINGENYDCVIINQNELDKLFAELDE